MAQTKIAFNTANLVARVTGHRFELSNWGQQHQKTAQQTDEKAWADICREISEAGYRAAEVWLAHVDPSTTDEAKAKQFRRIMDDHGLKPIGLAGGLTEDSSRVCQWMGIPFAAGGLGGDTIDDVAAIVEKTGIRYNLENHPEGSAAEIRDKIGGGSDAIGVAVDTGWLGTQGVDAPAVVRELGALVRHVHVKDVKAAGGHETCPLGEGVVDLEGVFRVLREQGYRGWYSWEDEPEDRNPMEIAAESRRWIEQRVEA